MKIKFLQILGVAAIAAFSFSSCETDACKDVDCGEYGTCVDGDCVCDTGYEGVNCDTQERTKFVAGYSVSESCTSGNYTYSVTVTTSTTGVDKIIVTNFGDYGIDVVGTVDGSSVTFANQTLSGLTLSGSGQLSGNILTITYTISQGSATDSCTMTCTKQ